MRTMTRKATHHHHLYKHTESLSCCEVHEHEAQQAGAADSRGLEKVFGHRAAGTRRTVSSTYRPDDF
jgi:hypothetical protein